MPTTIGTFYGVGLGPGDPQLLTLRAVDILRKVDIIFYVVGPRSRESISYRIAASVDGCSSRCEPLIFSMSTSVAEREASVHAAALRIAAELKAGRSCAFTTIGDPLIYSTYGYIQKEIKALLPTTPIVVVPGISSFQAAAAEWGEVLVEDEEVLTVVPRWHRSGEYREAIKGAHTVVALKSYRDRDTALETLREELDPSAFLYAARVGQPDQVIETEIEAMAERPIDYLSLMVAKRRRADA